MRDEVDHFLINHVGEWTNKQERELRKMLDKAKKKTAERCADAYCKSEIDNHRTYFDDTRNAILAEGEK